MEILTLLQNFFVALALGTLIGLEREYARYRQRGHDYAGIRTFPLISLFGALAAYLGEVISVYILVASIILMGTLIIVSYFIANQKMRKDIGTTSEVAGLLAFFIGILAYHGQLFFATVLAIAITIILYARSVLHNFAEKIQKKEMTDTLVFAVVAFVILPLLPNKGYGPNEMFNPFIIWLMVVFISGISFIGYILMKWFGEKGITLAGILGGIVSSTAVTMSFAERSRKEVDIYRSLALGVILANGMMFIMVLVEVFVLNTSLFFAVLLPMLFLAAATAVFSYFIWRSSRKARGNIKLGSPFTLFPALKFGAFFAAILALVRIADAYFSSSGVYVVSLISGLASIDAITVSLSQLAGESIALETARNGIVLAALTNVIVKGGIAWWFGGKKFGKIIISFFIPLIIMGILLMFLM